MGFEKLDIGTKIREFRNRKGFSQENMADLLEMSVGGYAKIEQNKTPNLTLKRLEQIANVLDTNIFELLSLGEKSVFYINDSQNNNTDCYIINKDLPQAHQTLLQENQFLKEKLTLLENEIINLKEIITLLKNSNSSKII